MGNQGSYCNINRDRHRLSMPNPEAGALSQSISRWLRPLVPIEAHEVAAVFWSFLYFFSLLGGYYILRPVRDEMGIVGGVENLQWLFTGTFIAMLAAVPLFAWVAARYPRRTFVPLVYYFFIANILIFYLLFRADVAEAAVARAFFIWTSVFNLFVVSVFWSFMADIFSSPQARRLFGFIAAGGSAGAIIGPGLTALIAPALGPINLLLVASGVLALALVAIHMLREWDLHIAHDEKIAVSHENPIGGGILSGVKKIIATPYLLGIVAFVLFYTTLSTFLYFQQAHIIEDAFSNSAQRTAVFAWIDFSVNALTILGQTLLTHRLTRRFGVGATLAIVPFVLMAGFAGLAVAPVLGVLLVVQVLRRAGNYALTRPAREMLFTVLDRESKYKSKNFIDTVVYRGGDAVAGWVFAGFMALGLGLSGTAVVAIPLAAIWFGLALWLGRRYASYDHEDKHEHADGAATANVNQEV